MIRKEEMMRTQERIKNKMEEYKHEEKKKDKLEEELQGLTTEIARYIEILNNRDQLLLLVKQELLEIKEQFDTPRKTEIIEGNFEHDKIFRHKISRTCFILPLKP